jgi:plasmid stabilization system protein ParE
MWPVIYLPEARDDVDEAYTDYEQRRTGLGDRFLERLRQRVEAIQANPYLYGVVEDDIRAAPLQQFPGVVYYRIEGAQVLIVAVVPGSSDPGRWQGRV